ncbi:MAG: hydroxymethylbilane synthase [Actinomycetota bacterium]
MGTRDSRLALAQTGLVVEQLSGSWPSTQFEIVTVRTWGDRDQSLSAPRLGDGIFVKEIQSALLAGEIDIAVHSLKDVPTDPAAGLNIAAIPRRANPGEALVGATLKSLEQGSRVGTSSPRRSAQLKSLRPDLQIVPLRGNVPTRVEKARNGEVAAVMLAAAGLARLNIPADEILNPEVILPAPGQGALAIEVRDGDRETHRLAAAIHDPSSYAEVVAERRVLRELGGGCLLPVAAYGRIRHGRLLLDGCVTSSDGSRQVRERAEGDPQRPMGVAKKVARSLIRQGAREILDV